MAVERYRCQHCKLPLVIHESLDELSIAQSNLLTQSRTVGIDTSALLIGEDPLIPQERMSLLGKVRAQKTDPMLNFDATDSYVLLPNEDADGANGGISASVRLTAISNNVNALDRINDVLNSEVDNDIDYPVCSFCADLLISQMKAKLDNSVREKQIYLQFYKRLENQPGQDPEKSRQHIEEIDELKKHEAKLISEYTALQKEQEYLATELRNLELESESLAQEESKTWAVKNQMELELDQLRDEEAAIDAQHAIHVSQLEKLKKSNVLNDVFKISHDGQFGTISGLRLGSLDSCRVSWHEINGALGQVVLLLATLMTKLNVEVSSYTLKPLGSYSKIEKHVRDPNGVAKVVVLECYSSGESSLQRLVNHYKFDGAMCALLDVLRQMEVHLHGMDDGIDLPYKIKDDRIGDLSVKLQSKVTSEEWTTACKCLLINTKWILAYASAHHA